MDILRELQWEIEERIAQRKAPAAPAAPKTVAPVPRMDPFWTTVRGEIETMQAELERLKGGR